MRFSRSLLLIALAACGEVQDNRHLPDAGIPATELSIDTIVIDDAECGAQPAARSIRFASSGTAPLAWSAHVEGAGFAIAGAASGEA
jgi:hypothetical protein